MTTKQKLLKIAPSMNRFIGEMLSMSLTELEERINQAGINNDFLQEHILAHRHLSKIDENNEFDDVYTTIFERIVEELNKIAFENDYPLE